MAVIVAISQLARVFAIAIHFNSSVIIVGKARTVPLEWSLVRGPTLVGSSLAHKYCPRVEVKPVVKTRAYYATANIMAIKKFYGTGSIPL
jgi:hypothetical protein